MLVITALVLALLASAAASSERASQHSAAMLKAESLLLIEVQTADSSQRGYLLTGRPQYLVPYTTVTADIPRQLGVLASPTHPSQRRYVADLEATTQAKLDELTETITLRRTEGADAA